jgi:hypothetical protein
MDAQKLQLKIFLTSESAQALELESLIPVFHRWIKEHTLPELLVDVTNYLHVPEGPGVVLIGHGSDYFLDAGVDRTGVAKPRVGLLHNRKRAGVEPADRLSDLVRRTLHAALLLEREPALEGKVRFVANELLFRVNDRLVAPNTDATFAAMKPELQAFASSLYPAPLELERTGGPKDPFAVRLSSAANVSLAALLERAGGPPGPDASTKSSAS